MYVELKESSRTAARMPEKNGGREGKRYLAVDVKRA
jgi:hypothetical protein